MARSTASWLCPIWALFALSAAGASPAGIIYEIDTAPEERLANAFVLGDWSQGDLDGWRVIGGRGEVRNGALRVIPSETGSPYAAMELDGIEDAPDLAYGFHNYLQLRLRLPPGDYEYVAVDFVTTEHEGFAEDRRFHIPGEEIPADGGWREYRIDLGLIIWWRDPLTGLRITPRGQAVRESAFEIDYVEIGDLPGDVLQVNTALNFFEDETLDDVSRVESKHFVVWWSDSTEGRFDPETHGRRALRMLEESYQVFCRLLGYEDPFEHTDRAQRDGTRYKLNHITWYGGFWMGGGDFTYFNVPPAGLLDEGWGNPVPHEFGHAIQGAQASILAGGHWESHANFLREYRTTYYAPFFPPANRSTVELHPLRQSNFRQDHSRLIYADYRIHLALADHGAAWGLPSNIDAVLWSLGPPEQTVYERLELVLPEEHDIKDVVASTIRHWPMLDFVHSAEIRAHRWANERDRAYYDYITGSHLIPDAAEPGWYRVPLERAPEKFAFMFHEIEPLGPTVTATLRGLELFAGDEDWRWCFVAIDAEDDARYSGLSGPGRMSFDLTESDNRVYIVVVATPGDTSLNLTDFSNTRPIGRHVDRLRYPYELFLENASPLKRPLDWTNDEGAAHPNGGGFVAATASVDETAYVGPNARVLDNATVRGGARIEDFAVVANNATVEDRAIVSGFAAVLGRARVSDEARVRDRGVLTQNARADGHALVAGHAVLEGGARASDRAIVRASAQPFGNGRLTGYAIADYDYSMGDDLDDGVHFNHVPWGGWFRDYYSATQRKPRGMTASYRVDEPGGDLLWDEFGALHALLRGNPRRVESDFFDHQVLELNGVDQYVILDRSLADVAGATFSMWVRPAAGGDRGPLISLSSPGGGHLLLDLGGDDRGPRLSLSQGGSSFRIEAGQSVPANQWSHIAVTLGADEGILYVDGEAVARGALDLPLHTLLGANDYSAAEAFYLGRDNNGRLLAAALNDMRFYNAALTQEELRSEMHRSGARIGAFFGDEAAEFGEPDRTEESGVPNGLVRMLTAEIRPDSFSGGDYYRPILDSNDERNGGRHGSGFGLIDDQIVVRLDGLGFWRTSVSVDPANWHRITVAFDGSRAAVYLDGELAATTEYEADPDRLAGKNYRIGWGQGSQDEISRTYFQGAIRDLRIYDRVFRPAEL